MVRKYIILFSFLWLGLFAKVIAQDTLYTKSGDVLTGNVESITFEKVFFKTAYRNAAIDIKLKEIESLLSHDNFVLNDVRNKNYKGKVVLDSTSQDKIGIRTADSVYFFKEKDVFEIIKDRNKKFIDKIKLGVDLGYLRAKTDNTLSLSMGLNFRFKTRRWNTGFDYNDYGAAIGAELVGRTSLNYTLSYILPKQWFFNGKILLYSSTEQSLDLRRNFSLGFGKNLIYSNSRHLAITAGLVSNKERFTNTENSFSNSEAMINAHMSGKIVDNLDLMADWTMFKSLEDLQRLRNSLSLDLKYTFLNHFNLGLSYVLNTDNKPPVETSNSDYVFEVKLGWTLHKK